MVERHSERVAEEYVKKVYETYPYPTWDGWDADIAMDRIRRHQGVLDHALRGVGAQLADLVGKDVLDGGCGTGTKSVALSVAGANVTGIDHSTASLSLGRQLADWVRTDVRWVEGSLMRTQGLFAPASFDWIVSWGVLHHLPNPERAFNDLVGLLRPGGTIVISVYSLWGNLWSRRIAWQWLIRTLGGQSFERRLALARRLCRRTPEMLLARSKGKPEDTMLVDLYVNYQHHFRVRTLRALAMRAGLRDIRLHPNRVSRSDALFLLGRKGGD